MTDALREALAALQANHEWHNDYDDHGGYPGSELETQNVAAVATLQAALAAQGQGEPVAWIDATTFHELTANPHGAIALHRWLSLWREDMHGRTIPLYATKPPTTEGEPQ